MIDWESQSQLLSEPFPTNLIHWRVGRTNNDKSKGMVLAYIDARDAMNRLDLVMGADWQCRYQNFGDIVICEIGLKVNGEWIWRSNGAGETQIEGEKGKVSDAFKRAAVLWGVGRYLYSFPTQWMPLDEYRNIQGQPKFPEFAHPSNQMLNRKVGQEYFHQIFAALEGEDAHGLRQLNDELKENLRLMKHVWNFFSTDQKNHAKALLNTVKDED